MVEILTLNYGKRAASKASKELQKQIELVNRKKAASKAKEHERRERAALQYAESAKKELEELKAQTQKIDGNYVKELENRVTIQKTALQGQLKKAIDDGDTETQVKVQTELANLAQDNNRLEYIKQQKEEATAPPQQSPDPKAIAWGEKNTWFGTDEPMTLTAFSIHKKLLAQGYDGSSDEYYEEMDKQMRRDWPQKFKSDTEQETVKNNGPVVASVSRNSGNTKKKTVKLSQSELAIARKIGVTPEQYAKQVLKIQAERNVNPNS